MSALPTYSSFSSSKKTPKKLYICVYIYALKYIPLSTPLCRFQTLPVIKLVQAILSSQERHICQTNSAVFCKVYHIINA